MNKKEKTGSLLFNQNNLKTMVRIINYVERVAEDGRSFFVLELQGGLEMIKSKTTGQFYATAKKASMSSTFDEETCKALIGTEMPGKIEKEQCDTYEYTIKDTGEIIELSHRYVYQPEEEIVESQLVKTKSDDLEKSDTFIKADVNTFSQNGMLETAH